MHGVEALTQLERDLALTKIQTAELELEILRENRAQRVAAAHGRRKRLEAAADEVKKLEQTVGADMTKNPAELPQRQTTLDRVEVGGGLASARTLVQATEQPGQAAAPVAHPQETWPDGSDLAVPKTFGVKPPFGELEPRAPNKDEYQRRLKHHFDLATRVLHTSGVVAIVRRRRHRLA